MTLIEHAFVIPDGYITSGRLPEMEAMSNKHINSENCYCGNAHSYTDCCGRYINGQADAPTAEALMRSRYSAFVVEDEAYLLKTWVDGFRPSTLTFEDKTRWLGLKIKRVEAGSETDIEGVVEFVARYKLDGRAHRIHEVSRFVKVNGCWRYQDGD